MQVRVKFLPPLRESIGHDVIVMELPAGATMAQLLAQLRAQFPSANQMLENVLYMDNYTRAQSDTVLQEGDEVICFKLLGGG
jgi:molybdopterin converting factor small subunit